MATSTSGMLPTYQRYVNGVLIPSSRKTLRLKEKYILLLVFVSFSTVCFGAFFFLPDLRDRMTMDEVRKQMGQVGQDILIPPAPIVQGQIIHDEHMDGVNHRDEQDKLKQLINVGLVDNRARLNMSKNDHEQVRNDIAQDKQDVLEKKRLEDEAKKKIEDEEALKENKDHESVDVKVVQPVSDDVTKQRQETIRGVCLI